MYSCLLKGVISDYLLIRNSSKKWPIYLGYSLQSGGLSMRCHRVTVYWDIKIWRTSERTCICRLDSSEVILSHSYYFFSCPGPFQVFLSHFLSQVILSHLESLKLLMLEVRQFNIRYTLKCKKGSESNLATCAERFHAIADTFCRNISAFHSYSRMPNLPFWLQHKL